MGVRGRFERKRAAHFLFIQKPILAFFDMMALLIVQPQWQTDSVRQRRKRFPIRCSEEQLEHTRLPNSKRFCFILLFFFPHPQEQSDTFMKTHSENHLHPEIFVSHSAVQQLIITKNMYVFSPLFTAHCCKKPLIPQLCVLSKGQKTELGGGAYYCLITLTCECCQCPL